MRNNLAALLLRHEFGCTETEDQICMEVNGVRCEVPKQALKNILQKEFDSILAANNNKKEYSNPVLVKEGNKPTLKTITEAKNEETVKAVIPENRIEIQENNKIRNVTKKIPKTEDAKKNRKPLPIEPDLLDMDFFGDVEEEAVQGEKNVEKKGPDIPLVKPSSTVIENKEDEPIHKAQEIHKNADPFEEFIFFEEEYELNTPVIKEKKKQSPEPVSEINKPLEIADDFDMDFGFFDEEPKQGITQNEVLSRKGEKIEKDSGRLKEKFPSSSRNSFRENISFFPEEKEQDIPKADVKPKFVTEVSMDDPDKIIDRLKKNRAEYDKKLVEQKILEEQKEDMAGGTVFDLSTGSSVKGMVDVKEAAGKIEKVADSIVEVSRKDKLLNMQVNTALNPGQYTYCVQKETDYERAAENFILDMYKLNIKVIGGNDQQIKEDQVKLIVAPIDIPESGTKLVTDICAYLENDGESHGAVVLPGGKTTITIRCEDYAVFVRGSWDNGNFTSNVSVVGSGNKAEYKIDKKEFRPAAMENIGIGHNILILDHATTVHVIPIGFKNTNYGYADFMGVVIKDYGIDKDAECQVVKEDGTIQVKGERYKFNISAIWEKKKLVLDSRIER